MIDIRALMFKLDHEYRRQSGFEISKLSCPRRRASRLFCHRGFPIKDFGNDTVTANLDSNDTRGHLPSGFSLLELLAAMSITAIAAVTVLTLFSKGIDIWEDVTFRGSSECEAALFLEGIEKELKNCINFSEIQFLGEAETIDFPAIISKNSGSSQEAIGRIKYSFDKDKMAVYKCKAVYPNCAQENLFSPHKILDLVESLSFEYAVLNAEGTLDWTGLWQDKQIIPKAVRVRIKLATNKGSDKAPPFPEKERDKAHNFERVVYIPIG